MKKHYSSKALLSSIRANRHQAIYRGLIFHMIITFSRGFKRTRIIINLIITDGRCE